MKESEIESWIGQQVRRHGGYFYKFVSPGNDGVPDRICILPGGIIIFVELKTKTGRLSKIQKYQLKRLQDLGCRTRVIYGMEEAKRFINEIRTTRLSEVCDTEDP